MKFVSFTHGTAPGYGVLTDRGIITLSGRCPWPDLRAAITAQALPRLTDLAAGLTPDLDPTDVTTAIPIPNPEKILCVGVNFPDRNAEYNDGSDASPFMSLFPRFPRSFTGAVRSADLAEARRCGRGYGDRHWHPDQPDRRRGFAMITEAEITIAAEALVKAERSRLQIGLLSLQYSQTDMDDAYKVQAAVVALRHFEGRKTVGWKIGLTSKARQSALNIASPDSGVLLDDMQFDDNATIPATRFIQPRIEDELSFIMKSPLHGPGVSVAQVMNATDYIIPALEILDTRILRSDPATGKTRTIVDTIADNAANAGIVTGGRAMRPDAFDPRWAGAIVMRNAEVEETGLGAGVLNQPARAVAWLAKRLARYGQRIEGGQIVLSGSFIRPIEARHGDNILADFGPLGTVGCHFV